MKYKVKAKLWLWGGGEKGSWHFVTIPPEISEKIKRKYKEFSRGWGSLPVEVEFVRETGARAKPAPRDRKRRETKIVKSEKVMLETSIFPNSKDQKYLTYLLPVKKKTRNELGVQDSDILSFILEIKIK